MKSKSYTYDENQAVNRVSEELAMEIAAKFFGDKIAPKFHVCSGAFRFKSGEISITIFDVYNIRPTIYVYIKERFVGLYNYEDGKLNFFPTNDRFMRALYIKSEYRGLKRKRLMKLLRECERETAGD